MSAIESNVQPDAGMMAIRHNFIKALRLMPFVFFFIKALVRI